MLRTTAIAWRVVVGMLMLNACWMMSAQAPQQGPRGQQGQNQGPPNPQDQAVKVAGQPANQSSQPLDEQKSAPVQVVTRAYDLNQLTHEPKVPETVFRGRVLWVQKCAFCHDGLGQPTYKTMGPWLDQDLEKSLGDEVTRAFIENGTAKMPAFKYGLSSSQMDDLVNFLKTVPASDKPTPAQLVGRRGAEGPSD